MAGNRTQVELALGEMERHDVCRGVVFVGSREGVGAERGGEGVVVLAEGEHSGAGADARLGIGLFELFDDGGFERRAPDLRSDVASFELDARTRVVPRSGKSILGQLAVGGFVGGRRGGFFQGLFPVLRRGGRAAEQEQGCCE